MTEKTYTVKPGDVVRLVIGKDGKQEPVIESTDEERERGVARAGVEDFRYLPRAKPSIQFFDLGTRLRSVTNPGTDTTRRRLVNATDTPTPTETNYNEYVEVALDQSVALYVPAPGKPSPGTPTINVAAFNRAVLGSRFSASDNNDTLDPLGFTPANGSGRSLPNCMPVPYSAAQDVFDMFLTLADAAGVYDYSEAYEIAAPAGTSAAQWKQKSNAAASERWSGVNVADNLAGNTGELRVKPPGDGFDIQSRQHKFFNTTDDAKVTSEPSFTAAAVPLSIKGKSLKIYLVPLVIRPYRIIYASASDTYTGEAQSALNPGTWFAVSGNSNGTAEGTDKPFFVRKPVAPLTSDQPRAAFLDLLYSRAVADFNLCGNNLVARSGNQGGIGEESYTTGTGALSASVAMNAALAALDAAKARTLANPNFRNIVYTTGTTANGNRVQSETHTVESVNGYAAPTGSLLAIVVAGSETFYLWKD